MIWLGEKRGYLSDWLTQLWVRFTGHEIDLIEQDWLDGPSGNSRRIGNEFFERYAREHLLQVREDGPRGLIQNFSDLCKDGSYPVAAEVQQFYERTSEYELDAWSEWCGPFKPFGWALATIFSRRLQQLNVPLSALDSSRGITSAVVQLRDKSSGEVVQTAWVRQLIATKNVLYAGSYSVCRVPGYREPCVKVVFPLPHGNAIVFMKPQTHEDGSFSVESVGKRFGDPGFYFVVHSERGRGWARYVRSLKETIRVYASEGGGARADHFLSLWGVRFLRLHYRMRVGASVS
ncbi:MAG TPA: hypothetical protein VGN17_17305 [Bryobacteraceae bacterium]